MADSNPYQTPTETVPNEMRFDLPLMAKLACFVGAVAVVAGCLGMLIGGLLGSLLPGYYRSVMPQGNEASFDPLAFGIGQGFTQGVVVGTCAGLVLVALYFWHQRLRRSQRKSISSAT